MQQVLRLRRQIILPAESKAVPELVAIGNLRQEIYEIALTILLVPDTILNRSPVYASVLSNFLEF